MFLKAASCPASCEIIIFSIFCFCLVLIYYLVLFIYLLILVRVANSMPQQVSQLKLTVFYWDCCVKGANVANVAVTAKYYKMFKLWYHVILVVQLNYVI